jgi:hypothetical protein
MMRAIRITFSLMLCLMLSNLTWGQTSGKIGRLFSEAIITDSASTIMFPITYNAELFTSNKAMTWGNYYANIIVYDFKADTYRKLFPEDIFIEAFHSDDDEIESYGRPLVKLRNLSRDWIFYKVQDDDYNENGKIEDKDPVVLYASNRKGEGLKPLTPKNENVISFTLYEKLGFAMVRIQRDANHDHNFKYDDKDFYLVKIDLSTLTPGNKIELGDLELK